MLRYVIPALALTLLVNSIATAQFFGAERPTSPSVNKPGRPVRIAKANETELPISPLDSLDALDQLDTPDEPRPEQKPAPLPSLLSPQSLDEVDLLGKPQPFVQAEELVPPTSSKSNESTPKSLSDRTPARNPIAHSVLTPSPITESVNFDDAIIQQRRDLAYSQLGDTGTQYFSGIGAGFAAFANESPLSHHQGPVGCGSTCGTILPNQPAILPPARSFHSYFKSNPCYFDIWASYPSEAAAACAHHRAKLAPGASCKSCELIEPCRGGGCR
jgi:hypothetical protein